jgi:hypothetical protein
MRLKPSWLWVQRQTSHASGAKQSNRIKGFSRRT